MEQPSLNYINELSGGDTGFQEKLIAVVKQELPTEILVYKDNMQQSNFCQAAENVHKLKHKLGILSLEAGYEIAVEYENQLKEGTKEHQRQFEAILKSCLDFINNF